MTRALSAWMNGELVGVWTQGRTGHHRFVYDRDWVNSPRARALSLSLPITASRQIEGPSVENYFDNLLPDSEAIRRRLRDRFKTGSVTAFKLLEAIGRDCVGAVQLLPAGDTPVGLDRLEYTTLQESDVARILRDVTAKQGPGANDDEEDAFRLSIAGAQEKTALLRLNGQWHRPIGATPTTHILKLPLGLVGGRRLDLTHSVENEWLCAQLMDALGMPVAPAEICHFEDEKALAVERFDRRFSADGTWIVRLPQEDFCQVMGKPSSEKYESDGGPSMADCLTVLAGSENQETDRRTFVCAQLVFWILAATDGHAKNFSIFLQAGDRYSLTPLYDVVSAWPIIGDGRSRLPWKKARLAMAVRSKNAHCKLAEIHTRHWHELALRTGGDELWRALTTMVERVDATVQTVEGRLPANFPAETANAIFAGARAQVAAFQAGLPV